MSHVMDTPARPRRGRLEAFLAVWCIALALSFFYSARIKSIALDAPAPLASFTPKSLPDWELLPDQGTMIVNPEQAATIQQIYDETLAYSYRDKRTGAIVMLALAYGRDQSHKNQVHKPEVCYPSQGFQLSNVARVDLPVDGKLLPSTRLTAQLGSRVEFVQYWMLQGDRVIRGALQQNLYRTARALHGERTDGLLFRTSVIARDADEAYREQDAFVKEFFEAVPPAQRERFIGK